jgi:hypothetical protein
MGDDWADLAGPAATATPSQGRNAPSESNRPIRPDCSCASR